MSSGAEGKSFSDNQLLRLDGVSVTYGVIPAVQTMALTVRRGEVVCLLGRNGAGKSSTLNAIMGLVATSSGRIFFRDEDVTRRPIEARVRRGMALAPEGRQVFAGLTVQENLRLAGCRLAHSELSDQLDGLFELFPVLQRKLNIPSGSMSGGEQQQLALARALLSGGELLMLDEPSLGLDPINVRKIFDVLHELKRRNLTILLAEQNVERALEFADTAYVLAAGRVALQGPAASMAHADIEGAYLGITAAGNGSRGGDAVSSHEPERSAQ